MADSRIQSRRFYEGMSERLDNDIKTSKGILVGKFSPFEAKESVKLHLVVCECSGLIKDILGINDHESLGKSGPFVYISQRYVAFYRHIDPNRRKEIKIGTTAYRDNQKAYAIVRGVDGQDAVYSINKTCKQRLSDEKISKLENQLVYGESTAVDIADEGIPKSIQEWSKLVVHSTHILFVDKTYVESNILKITGKNLQWDSMSNNILQQSINNSESLFRILGGITGTMVDLLKHKLVFDKTEIYYKNIDGENKSDSALLLIKQDVRFSDAQLNKMFILSILGITFCLIILVFIVCLMAGNGLGSHLALLIMNPLYKSLGSVGSIAICVISLVSDIILLLISLFFLQHFYKKIFIST